MNTFVMAGADQCVLLHHMASYGLADILHTTGVTGLTLAWCNGYPTITADGLDSVIVDNAVRTHIEGRKPWTQQLTESDKRGLMSPRITVLKTAEDWNAHQAAREKLLDELTNAHAWTDLRYLAALGEPSYWSFNRRNELLQDNGASRLEMQPRNRGSEFVGNRLRPLTEKLLARKPGQIVAGLNGSSVIDELGGKPDSVSATGLTTPGPVDNALVWCALWGIGQLPLALRREGTALTSGHLGHSRREWFYVPVWTRPWRPARLRSMLATAQLHAAAAANLPDIGDDLAALSAATWLRANGTIGILRFPIGRFGSDNAPERRALRGEAIPL